MKSKIGPAYRIESPRLVIRCWEPKDAPLLKKSIEESREHLKPWMPWAHGEPETLDIYIERLRKYRSLFDTDQDYIYGIFNKEESKVLGGTGLHNRVGETAREIGYWIHGDHINQGFATEAVLALVKVGFTIEKLTRMEIHCDPENIASATVPEKTGFELEAVLKNRQPFLDKLTDSMIWTTFYDQYSKSPAARIKINAFDVTGNQIV